MCASRLGNLESSALRIFHQVIVNIRTLICKNYSMSRNFNSGRPKEDCDIRVVGVIEKADSNQLGDQSHDEVLYLVVRIKSVSGALVRRSAFRHSEFGDRSRHDPCAVI